jgi:hypothetical protein
LGDQREVTWHAVVPGQARAAHGPGRYDPDYEQAGRDYPLPYVRWTEQRSMEAFLALVADRKVTPKRLITHRYAIADAEDAYRLMETGKPYLAILLNYPDGARPRHRSVGSRGRRCKKLKFLKVGHLAAREEIEWDIGKNGSLVAFTRPIVTDLEYICADRTRFNRHSYRN